MKPVSLDSLTDREACKTYLATELKKGTLVLFLGAGTSSGLGLPSWKTLVAGMRRKVGLPPARYSRNITAEELQLAADEVKDHLNDNEDAYHKVVRDCLYAGVKLSSDILHDPLLRAVGALLMGSNKRGNIQRVVTTNFDCMLEWYLSLFGFSARVVYRQRPEVEGAEDVRIYHPHGFLPHTKMGLSDSDFLLLGFDSVNKRIGKRGDYWFELTRHLIGTGIGLFVGLSVNSFRDAALRPLFATISEDIGSHRPMGVWILVGKVNSAHRREFLKNRLVPLYLPKYEEVPKFLFEVCQAASPGLI